MRAEITRTTAVNLASEDPVAAATELNTESTAAVTQMTLPVSTAPVSANLMVIWGRSQRWLVRGLAILGALVFWHIAASQQWDWIISFNNVPTPLQVGDELIAQLQNDTFYTHIVVSLKRILIGYVLAAISGIVIGVLMGRYAMMEDIFTPYIEILRPIPAVAWIPLAILMMPTEESSIVFITYLGALFPIILNTLHGVEQTPSTLIRAARSFGASDRAILWHVVIPGAMPSIVAGLAIGMGVSWFSLLAGEIISGQYGIGYFTWAAYTLVEYPRIIIGMLVIGALGTLSTALVKLGTRPLLRWQTDKGSRS